MLSLVDKGYSGVTLKLRVKVKVKSEWLSPLRCDPNPTDLTPQKLLHLAGVLVQHFLKTQPGTTDRAVRQTHRAFRGIQGQTDRQTEREREKYTDRQTDRLTDRQAWRWTDRKRDRQTHRQSCRHG